MTVTNTVWKKHHEFTSHFGHNEIKIDGARQNGFGPKSLLLSGLAGCSGIDIVDILKKMRVDFSEFTIEVKAEQTTEDPKVYKDIFITYKIKTGKENKDKVKKAIDLSLEKYCGVAAMLRKNSPIHYTLEIIK
ncbi:MAG TPA: OsmC family protein [Chitinophagaceae bacterium]|nr:OsmC family protein [Chitinophagaceae bacterium]